MYLPLFKEPLFETFARAWRLKAVLPHISAPATLVDFGCGPHAPLFCSLDHPKQFEYIGIDPLAQPKSLHQSAKIIQSTIEHTKLTNNSADIVTMLAVLEHVDDPVAVLSEAHRILQPKGILLITTPSPWAKPILEFSSNVLGTISKREIEEHKRYYTKLQLQLDLEAAGFSAITINQGWLPLVFTTGLNLFVRAEVPH